MPSEDLTREGFVPRSPAGRILPPPRESWDAIPAVPSVLTQHQPVPPLGIPPLSICPLFLRSDPLVGWGREHPVAPPPAIPPGCPATRPLGDNGMHRDSRAFNRASVTCWTGDSSQVSKWPQLQVPPARRLPMSGMEWST